MEDELAAILERFAVHVEQQRSARESGRLPTEKAIEERESIMVGLVRASEISEEEIQEGLGINRTTWERWKRMQSVPNRAYVDHLRRLVAENVKDRHQNSNVRDVRSLPSAFEFISQSPRTYNQLRVLFFHANYHWKKAILHFNQPFYDAHTVVDMASLALNGCQIVYMVSPSLICTDNEEAWIYTFVQKMVQSLGRKTSARALANFCFLEIDEVQDKTLEQFGVFNFGLTKQQDKVGWFWEDKSFSPNSIDHDKLVEQHRSYSAARADDERFDVLKLSYEQVLADAFDLIEEERHREVQGEFNHERNAHPFDILSFGGKNSNKKHLTVYVQHV